MHSTTVPLQAEYISSLSRMNKNSIDFHWAPHKWVNCLDLIIYFLPLESALKPKKIVGDNLCTCSEL